MKTRRLYPLTTFAQTNSLADQLAHVFSEVDEVAIEAEMIDAHCADIEKMLPLFRELGDLQASIGTVWDVLDRLFGVGFSERLILSWTEEKNLARGYYVEAPAEIGKRHVEVVFRGESERGADWALFAVEVARHVESYTVPQYGDKGADQASGYTAEDHVKQAQKYLNRFGRNVRPGQQRLDFLKAAHYCQMAADVCESKSVDRSVVCPSCGNKYVSGSCYECPACSHEWDEMDVIGFAKWLRRGDR
jgi:hypothetical protein